MRVGQREVRRPRGRRYAARRAVCARWGSKGLPLAGGTRIAKGGCQRQKQKKNIRTVGFEPTPSKRPVPETGALDRSARSARGFLPLVCYITLANSRRTICFVRQKNPFSSFSPLRRRVPRLTLLHPWTPTRPSRSRALERSCALFRGDARAPSANKAPVTSARDLYALQEKPPHSYQTHQGDLGQKAPQISVPGVLAVDRGAFTRSTTIAATKQLNQLAVERGARTR